MLMVYVLNMDETLAARVFVKRDVFANSSSGSRDVKMGLEIRKMWEKLILDLFDGYFFYEQVSAECLSCGR